MRYKVSGIRILFSIKNNRNYAKKKVVERETNGEKNLAKGTKETQKNEKEREKEPRRGIDKSMEYGNAAISII